jgi:hypothetical protein
VGRAREALDSGDPSRLRAAHGALMSIRARQEQHRSNRALEAARKQLTELSHRGQEVLARSDGALDPNSRALLTEVLERSEELIREGSEPSTGEEAASWTRAIQVRHEALENLLDSVSGLAEAPVALAPSMTEAVAEAAVRAEPEDAAMAAERHAAGDEVRSAARRLTATLEQAAASLPVDRIADAKVLIAESEVVLAEDDPEAMRSIGKRISDEAGELRRLAERAEEYRTSRESAERKRIIDGAKRFRGMAGGSDAKKLGALIDQVQRAGAGELSKLDAGIRTITAKVGNRIRTEAAGLALRAEQHESRKGEKTSTNETEKAAADLAVALEQDDLEAMVPCSAVLRRELPKVGRVQLFAGLAALAVIILIGGFLIWRSMSEDTHTYELSLTGTDRAAGEVPVMLVQDGTIVEQNTSREGRPVTFDLTSGRYEVFVDGRYTGIVIRVPDDPPQVTGIPYPR